MTGQLIAFPRCPERSREGLRCVLRAGHHDAHEAPSVTQRGVRHHWARIAPTRWMRPR